MTELIRLMEVEGWILSVTYLPETGMYLAALQSPGADASKFVAQDISIAAAMQALDFVVTHSQRGGPKSAM